jgi:hypothetical protein
MFSCCKGSICRHFPLKHSIPLLDSCKKNERPAYGRSFARFMQGLRDRLLKKTIAWIQSCIQ